MSKYKNGNYLIQDTSTDFDKDHLPGNAAPSLAFIGAWDAIER